MKKTLVAAVLAVLAVTTTACSSNEDTAAKSISDTMMKQQGSTGAAGVLTLKKSDADCVGKGLVAKIGTKKLQEYGVLDKNMHMNKNITSVKMSPQDANKAADTFLGCTDVMKSMDKALAQAGTIDPKVRACIDKKLTKPTVHDMFVGMFSGNQAQATKALSAKLMQCAMGSSPTG